MNICLIGDYSSNLDEGLKNIAHYTANELSKKHNVATLNIKKPFDLDFIRNVLTFKPDVIHYFTGPTLASFIVLKLIGFRWNKSKKIISALHPKSFKAISSDKKFLKLAGFLRPDLILVQESMSKQLFESIGYKTKLIHNGVDINKFSPVDNEEKIALRKKYGIDQNKFVLLHVGHLSRVRNLQIFESLQRNDQQVVIVGSTYLGEDIDLYKSLTEKGCIVYKGYCKNVNELYALADCYIFPVDKGNSIFMPLSVLEAMSCNLPVISTKFEGLINAFSNGGGLFFEDDVKYYPEILSDIRKGVLEITTREKVSKYSWENIAEELTGCYSLLLDV